jgi:hypothetical protein
MRNVFVERAELFVAKTVNVEVNSFVKTEFVKSDVAQTIRAQKLNRVSTNNVLILAQFWVNVAHVLNVTFIIMEFNVVAKRE